MMEERTEAEESPEAHGEGNAGAGGEPSTYVALVYFHGMGSQRHYEEVSKFVDALDAYLHAKRRSDHPKYRTLLHLDVGARMEPSRSPGDDRDVVYIRSRVVDESSATPPRTLRFYEAFWAPETVDGTSLRMVALWLTRQVRKPLQVLVSQWRAFNRLRQADLIALYHERRERLSKDEADRLRGLVSTLLRRYREFQTLEMRARYLSGTFREFLRFVSSKGKHPRQEELLALAKAWRRRHLLGEWQHLADISTVLGGGVGALILIVIAATHALGAISTRWPGSLGPVPLPHITPSPSLVIAFVSGLLSFLGIRRFMVDSVGDVQQYASYEETDRLYARRRAVLDRATQQLRHVICDEHCERVVLVAHSLGTAVALDAMLNLARYNRARTKEDPLSGPLPINKIQHFLTYGCPIDKINYFFAVLRSRSGTYEALVESIRGDIGTAPFSKSGRQPWIHWINYWDKGDVISGAIESVSSSYLRAQEVDNVRVVRFVFPDPLGSHTRYLDVPELLDDLLRITLENDFSYAQPPRVQDRPDYASVRRGPGRSSVAQTAFFAIVLLFPWLLLATSVDLLFNLGLRVSWALGSIVLVLVCAQVVHTRPPSWKWRRRRASGC